MELIGDLLPTPTPTPLVKWRSPEELARKHKPGTQGLCSKQNGVVVELSNELGPRDAATVTAHELAHAAQLYGGMSRPSDSQRDEAERQARRFSVLAMQEFIERHGTFEA